MSDVPPLFYATRITGVAGNLLKMIAIHLAAGADRAYLAASFAIPADRRTCGIEEVGAVELGWQSFWLCHPKVGSENLFIHGRGGRFPGR